MTQATRIAPGLAAFAEIATPALVIDLPVLDANLARMAAAAMDAGVALRPHAKTHKSPDIARRQLDAGAVGIACATIGEAEALAARGIHGLLLTAPFGSLATARRLLDLNQRAPMLAVVDHPAQVELLHRASRPSDPPVSMLVDVDVGQRRTGVANAGAGAELAGLIAADGRFRFAGVQGYAGHVQHIVDPDERRAAAGQSSEVLARAVEAIETEGLAVPLISGSGTGAFAFDRDGPYTELQTGSYALMDADYDRVRRGDGEDAAFGVALYVLATVVSASRPGQVTIDAGTKAIATNGPPPHVILGADGARFRFGGDEHGILDLPAGAAQLPIGTRLLLSASHCDPTVNLHDAYRVWHPDVPLQRWPIEGRYTTTP
ncbi:DSD1 family PLP-dependent enzyme [Chelatococcus reniformis]|uniref:Alanine racemase n=1 Tax=Chelatococcus reniformis TaxID=1494448 RepID=A0A916UTB3_9HYPH|nr:DSD1 family PLP-dependent enzyme [Chelatococcus reniformis]GGC86815.1 alanine racemase [Chelatococcus reniformis]